MEFFAVIYIIWIMEIENINVEALEYSGAVGAPYWAVGQW
jgi:hypothetical protein